MSLFIATLVAASFAHAAPAPLETGIVGSWTLSKMEIVQSADEAKGKPWCVNPRGILIYSAEGHMSASINCGTAKKPGSISPEAKDMVFYAGTYVVMPPDRVLHRVQHASSLLRVDQRLERIARIDGDKLTIIGEGVKGLVRLVWTRARRSE